MSFPSFILSPFLVYKTFKKLRSEIFALIRDLNKFEGTILFVSHDRWLVENLATRMVESTPAGIDGYPDSYTERMARTEVDCLDTEQTWHRGRLKKKKRNWSADSDSAAWDGGDGNSAKSAKR